MKTCENVKCDVKVRIKIKKHRIFHVWLFGVDLTICKLNKHPIIFVFLFSWFDSLRSINNLSVIKGRVFLGWTNTKLGLMFLLKDTTQWRRWGSNPRPFGLESSALPPIIFVMQSNNASKHATWMARYTMVVNKGLGRWCIYGIR